MHFTCELTLEMLPKIQDKNANLCNVHMMANDENASNHKK